MIIENYNKTLSTINNILTKDGTYPKHLQRQLTNGINEFKDHVEEFVKSEEQEAGWMREILALYETQENLIRVDWDEETSYAKDVEWLGDYDGPKPPAIDYFLTSKSFKDYSLKWTMDSMNELAKELENIKDWTNYTPEQKKELRFKVYDIWSNINSKPFKENQEKLITLTPDAYSHISLQDTFVPQHEKAIRNLMEKVEVTD